MQLINSRLSIWTLPFGNKVLTHAWYLAHFFVVKQHARSSQQVQQYVRREKNNASISNKLLCWKWMMKCNNCKYKTMLGMGKVKSRD